MMLQKENSTYCSFIEIQGSGKFEIYKPISEQYYEFMETVRDSNITRIYFDGFSKLKIFPEVSVNSRLTLNIKGILK